MPGKGLNLLSLDGGGIRGLSSLFILRNLMGAVATERGWEQAPKPCEFFDMIGGTSTGGLIAIMLGKLEMTIDECINSYIDLSADVFEQVHRFPVKFNGNIQARFDSAALERHVKAIIKRQGFSEDELLKSQEGKCKVFVVATNTTIAKPVCLTSYKTKRTDIDRLNHVRVWQAALATSAASTFFDPVTIPMGLYNEVYVDGATGANNPIHQVWNEANDVWLNGADRLEDNIDCLVSIGTGIPSLKPFGQSLKAIGQTLVQISTETEETAEEFHRAHVQLFSAGKCCRFNVNGLESVGLEETAKKDLIIQATKAYLQSQRVLDIMGKVIECLKDHECEKRSLVLRDEWALASHVGSGKTMLATLVVQTLLEKREKNDSTILYYYAEQAGPHNQSALAVLRSFTRQLLLNPQCVERYRSKFLLSKIERLFHHGESFVHEIELLDLFDFLVKSVPEVVIVIDGLHEMTREEAQRVCDCVDHFLTQVRGPRMRVAMFNRSRVGELVLGRRLSTPWHIELSLRLLADDIATFVQCTVDYMMQKERMLSQDLRIINQVKQELIIRGSRMFLWIHLQILSLWRNCTNDQEIEDALETLPEGLDAAYVRCLEQIDSSPTSWRYAPDIFKWLALTERPLRESEVQEIISLKSMQDDWDVRRITRIPIADHCANLVEATEDNGVVRFIHPSVKDFLISNVPQILSRYAVDIQIDQVHCGELCVQYLALPVLGMALTESSRQHTIEAVAVPDTVLSEFPVARTLARFWYHTDVRSQPLTVGRYLPRPPRAKPDPHADQFSFLLYARKYWLSHARHISETSSQWGKFKSLVLSPNPIRGLQPWAVDGEYGAKHLMELFKYGLRTGFIKLLELTVNFEGYKHLYLDFFNVPLSDSGWHCLHFAAAFDKPSVVEYLLPSVNNIDIADQDGDTALHIATSLQDSACATLLCNAGADIFRLGKEQVTPLNIAVLRDNRVVLRSMLVRTGKVDFPENMRMPASLQDLQARELYLGVGQEILYLGKAAFDAVSVGHAHCLDLLLEMGVPLSLLNHHDWSMLHVAVAKVKLNIIELLLTRLMDVNIVDRMGRTPLHIAVLLSIEESLAATRVLLQMPNIDTSLVLSHMSPIYSPLDLALELFLMNWSTSYQGNISQSAWQNITNDVQQYCDYPLPRGPEDLGAEIELLHFLTTVEHQARVRGITLASKRQNHRDLFESMLKTLPQTIVAQFVTCGFFSLAGYEDCELLHKAISYADLETVKAFLNLKSDSYLRGCDGQGRNAIHAAVLSGNRDVMKALLQKVDKSTMDQTDEKGQSPLHLSALFGQGEIMQDLIEASALVNVADEKGQTPFHLACIYGNAEVRNLLKAAGAEQDYRDKVGMTAEDHLIEREEFEKIPFSVPPGSVILMPSQPQVEMTGGPAETTLENLHRFRSQLYPAEYKRSDQLDLLVQRGSLTLEWLSEAPDSKRPSLGKARSSSWIPKAIWPPQRESGESISDISNNGRRAFKRPSLSKRVQTADPVTNELTVQTKHKISGQLRTPSSQRHEQQSMLKTDEVALKSGKISMVASQASGGAREQTDSDTQSSTDRVSAPISGYRPEQFFSDWQVSVSDLHDFN